MEDEELERLKKKKLQEMIEASREAPGAGTVADLDGSSFDAAVSRKGLALVDFWAEWCGPCKLMHPVFDRLARKYRGVAFGRVNVDQDQPLAARYGIQAIPTFIMFKDGRKVDTMMGAVGEPGIHMIIAKHSGAR